MSDSTDFIDSFCVYSSWDDDLWQGAPLADWTPCFEDVVILGSVHIVVLVLCCIRILAIWRSSMRDRALYKTKAWPVAKSMLALVITAVPVVQLVGKLLAGSELAPFDIATNSLFIAVWGLITLMLVQEALWFIYLKADWIMRFNFVLMAVAQSLKFSTVLRLNDGVFGAYFIVYCVGLTCMGILACDALLNWSDKTEFAEYAGDYTKVEEEKEDDRWDNMTCPEARANPFSRILFSWVFPLVSRAYERPLKDRDVWCLGGNDLSQNIAKTLDKAWREEQRKSKPSLVKVMVRVFGWPMFTAGIYKTFNDASQFTGPMFLSALVGFVADKESLNMGFIYAFAMFFSQILGVLGEGQYFQNTARVGMRMKGGFVALILRKVMVLSTAARSRVSTGKINNLLTSDTDSLEDFASTVHVLWSSPLRIIICLYLLFVQLGWAAFVGFAGVFLVLPIQKKIMTKSVELTMTSREKTDERVKYTSEMLASMNIVKMYAWETSMQKRINAIRDEELSWIKKGALLSGINFFIILTVPLIVSVVALAVFAAQEGNTLTAARAFTALALFGVLRFPLILLPSAINSVAVCRASVTRLQEFLQEEELEPPVAGKTSLGQIVIDKGTFWWGAPQEPQLGADKNIELAAPLLEKNNDTQEPSTKKEEADSLPTLQNISLSVVPGRLVAVVGSTGCGKSSLVQAVLGEMPVYNPPDCTPRKWQEVVQTKGKIAYVPQQAWIFNATVQENILFGKEYNKLEYETALRCACLQADLAQLPYGDQTEIGEKGVNLSGGQKLRVSLARAVYARAEIYLLDDPLAALDAHVAKEVFDGCINGVLRERGATRLLVTNHLSVLPQCDMVVVISNHTFEIVAPYAKARNSPALARLLAEHTKKEGEEDEKEQQEETKGEEKGELVLQREASEGAVAGKAPQDKLIKDEEQNVGTMNWRYIKIYLKASGVFMFGLVSLFAILQQLFSLGSNYWISVWTSDPPQLVQPDGSPYSNGFYIGLYGAWNFAVALATFLGRIFVALSGVNAGRSLHRDMLANLLLLPMQFYQQTPLGRILNRFTSDIGAVDRMLPFTFSLFFYSVLSGIVAIAGIGLGTPYAIIAFVPVFLFFFWLQRYFQHSSRELKRLNSTTRSPVYSHFDAVLTGIPSIRAYNKQDNFVAIGCEKIDHNMRVDWANTSCNRWLTLRLEFIGGLMTLAVSVSVVILRDGLNESLAGLVMSYAITITSLLTLGVQIGSSFENSFNSVERIVDYTEDKPSNPREKPFIITETEPAKDWPQQGAIKFKNVSMRYRKELPLVLNEVSFFIPAKSKVGVVGRTGAGKSSLFLSLFRIVELSHGSVEIDGINVAKIGLHTLRSRISIIPQEPILFTGTVRFNLDPFDEHSDDELWAALEHSFLKDVIEKGQTGQEKEGGGEQQHENKGLLMRVEENGSNFSVGQRQLLCLARTLVRKSRIIVLDEATAAVDSYTDSHIQKAIRREFCECTMLTIAHRINTVIDNDLIMVLDQGRVVEFASPHELLSREDSSFSKLVADLGPQEAEKLKQLAAEKAQQPK